MMIGGCYCGELRYLAKGEPIVKAQCHCRECQTVSGGGPSLFMVMPLDGFSYTKGTPKSFTRSDLDSPVIREFCGNCGTHILAKRRELAGVALKIGTLDDPRVFESAQVAIFTKDSQAFHQIPDGIPTFESRPPSR